MASRSSRLTLGRRVQFEIIDIGNVSDFARYVLESVSRARRNFPPAMTVQLPALKVDVHLQEGDLARSIVQNLLQTSSPATTTASQSIEIFIAHPGIDDVPRPAAWGAEPYWPHEVSTLLDREGLRVSYFHDLDQWQIFDAGAAVGVELLRAHDQYPPWEPGAPLRPFLHWHYANQGMRLAHCGTLGLNGAGVLLAGAGGAGKSGTVMAGLLNGLQSVGDDYVLLDASDQIVAYPVFATLKQDQQGFDRLGLKERLASPGTLNWQGKYEFRIGDICDQAPPAKLRIKALFVPRIGDGSETRIVPLSKRDAMLAFAPSSLQQMPGERQSGFIFFSRVANNLPCYTIELGSDPTEIANAVADFLEKAV